MTLRGLWIVGIALLTTLPLSGKDAVLEWNQRTLDVIRQENTPLPMATRILAMVHIAIFDTVNSIEHNRQPFFTRVEIEEPVSMEAAITAAAHRILTELYPQQAGKFDHELVLTYGSIPDGPGKKAAIQTGRDIAQQIIDWRSDDNSRLTISHKRPGGPGQWKAPTPTAAIGVQWPLVNTFVLPELIRFRPGPPPSLTSDQYTQIFYDAKKVGTKQTRDRTGDQTASVFFWDGGTTTLAGYWNGVAQQISQQNKLSLAQNAHLFALLNLALADTAIAVWDCKYHYCFWHPLEAIHQADQDGNDSTASAPKWTPLLPTPSYPDYVSAYSAISSAAAQILTAYFGDAVPYSSDVDGQLSPQRHFHSFNQAAEEAGRSRVWGGISFQSSHTAGQKLGRQVATYVIQNTLSGKNPLTADSRY